MEGGTVEEDMVDCSPKEAIQETIPNAFADSTLHPSSEKQTMEVSIKHFEIEFDILFSTLLYKLYQKLNKFSLHIKKQVVDR